MGYCVGAKGECECSNNALKCSGNKNCAYESKLKEKNNDPCYERKSERTREA